MAEAAKKLFTQRELEKHINARLMRERKKNGELEAFKRMLDELISSGAIDANSYAEAGERFIALIAGKDEGAKAEAEKTDISVPAKEPDVPIDEITQEVQDIGEEMYVSENAEASFGDNGVFPKEKRAEENVAQSKAEDGTQEIGDRLFKLCSELAYLLSGANKNCDGGSDERGEFFARRSASSTGFSQRSALEAVAGGAELTPTQREIARRAGISYREYAELLRQIPENIKRENRSFKR